MGEKEVKKRLRFTYEDDVLFLREVVARNPFRNGTAAWNEIQGNVLVLTQKKCGIKTLRQHLQMMLEYWKEKDTKHQKTSGDEEPYSEKDGLLQEINDICEVEKCQTLQKQMRKLAGKNQIEMGRKNRDEMASSFLEMNIEKILNDHVYSFLPIHGENVENIVLEEQSNVTEDPVVEEVLLETNEANVSFGMPNGQDLEEHNVLPSTPVNSTSHNTKKILGPVRSRGKKTSYMRRTGLDYLKEKNYKETKLEEKRLVIEERKVAVAERNISLAEKKNIFESQTFKEMFENQKHICNR